MRHLIFYALFWLLSAIFCTAHPVDNERDKDFRNFLWSLSGCFSNGSGDGQNRNYSDWGVVNTTFRPVHVPAFHPNVTFYWEERDNNKVNHMRLLTFTWDDKGNIRGQSFNFTDPSRFWSWEFNEDDITNVTLDDLEAFPPCELVIQHKEKNIFIATYPDCVLDLNGNKTEFESFISDCNGFDGKVFFQDVKLGQNRRFHGFNDTIDETNLDKPNDFQGFGNNNYQKHNIFQNVGPGNKYASDEVNKLQGFRHDDNQTLNNFSNFSQDSYRGYNKFNDSSDEMDLEPNKTQDFGYDSNHWPGDLQGFRNDNNQKHNNDQGFRNDDNQRHNDDQGFRNDNNQKHNNDQGFRNDNNQRHNNDQGFKNDNNQRHNNDQGSRNDNNQRHNNFRKAESYPLPPNVLQGRLSHQPVRNWEHNGGR